MGIALIVEAGGIWVKGRVERRGVGEGDQWVILSTKEIHVAGGDKKAAELPAPLNDRVGFLLARVAILR